MLIHSIQFKLHQRNISKEKATHNHIQFEPKNEQKYMERYSNRIHRIVAHVQSQRYKNAMQR